MNMSRRHKLLTKEFICNDLNYSTTGANRNIRSFIHGSRYHSFLLRKCTNGYSGTLSTRGAHLIHVGAAIVSLFDFRPCFSHLVKNKIRATRARIRSPCQNWREARFLILKAHGKHEPDIPVN